MKSPVIKRSIVIAGHKTSVSLEDAFWKGLKDIADDRRFEDLTAIWLAGDHYKWRAMRCNGIPESHITGTRASRSTARKRSP